MSLFAYLTSFVILLLQATVPFPFPVFAFIPYQATLALKKPISSLLWLSSLGALPLEFLSSDPLGLYSLSCLVTTAIGYRLRYLFSSDSWIQFSFLAGILSFIQLPITAIFLFLFDRRIPFQGKWWFVDLPILALADACYAAVWFVGPYALYRLIRKNWDLYWLKKRISAT
jgi:hypothetical protein